MRKLEIHVPEKLSPFLTKRKRYKIAVGGRGSGKSMTLGDLLLYSMSKKKSKICSMREYQTSIEDSSYSLFVEEIKRIRIPGFVINKSKIDNINGAKLRFKGLARGIQSIKSYHGFDIFFIEEAQFLSNESIRILTPTLRKEDSEIWMAMNPGSSEDPVSKNFLNFCWEDLLCKGYYEDNLHYIVMINYSDNPMFPKILEEERSKDKKILPRALYDHIWEGQFNDSIENALIMREWFDACVDAHKKLGFKPRGLKICGHDVADEGKDSKSFVFRFGSVIFDVQEKNDGDVNEGADWAVGLAKKQSSHVFTWDATGMGASLKRQISEDFESEPTVVSMFCGAEKVDFPDSIHEPIDTDKTPIHNQRTNDQALKNKRAQYYYELRSRIYKTYKAVVHNEYSDPDLMISFDSSIKLMNKLRSELCRIPVKPNKNGLFELYTKEEMSKNFKLKSPNLADGLMMTLRVPSIKQPKMIMPRPINIIGDKRYGIKNFQRLRKS
jgi:phage terminase large subunit